MILKYILISNEFSAHNLVLAEYASISNSLGHFFPSESIWYPNLVILLPYIVTSFKFFNLSKPTISSKLGLFININFVKLVRLDKSIDLIYKSLATTNSTKFVSSDITEKSWIWLITVLSL